MKKKFSSRIIGGFLLFVDRISDDFIKIIGIIFGCGFLILVILNFILQWI